MIFHAPLNFKNQFISTNKSKIIILVTKTLIFVFPQLSFYLCRRKFTTVLNFISNGNTEFVAIARLPYCPLE